jgi:tetratricopeptide (TPR) repeat protein
MATTEVDARMYMEQGRQKFAQRDYDSAADHFRKALELNPQLHEGHRYLAESYEKLGYRHRAKKAWEALLRITQDPERQQEINRRVAAL